MPGRIRRPDQRTLRRPVVGDKSECRCSCVFAGGLKYIYNALEPPERSGLMARGLQAAPLGRANKRMHATADTQDFILGNLAWRRVMRGVRCFSFLRGEKWKLGP